ncbi:hypothetical protein LJC74_01325 [Eubacteriales bacterium OttesenSCG-928-A19]|nr:hypothetical protein [Eubacteriales bacterium OttesenSCG-928-A19]
MKNERSYRNEALENLLQDALASVVIPEESREIINAYYETNLRQQTTFTIRIMPETMERFERMLCQMADAGVDRFVLCHIPDEMLAFDWLIQNYGYHIAAIAGADGPYRNEKEGLFITTY